MTLITQSKLPIAPAIGDSIGGTTPLSPALSPTQAGGKGGKPLIGNGVGVAEVTSWKILHIRGNEAAAALSGVYEIGLMAIGAVRTVSDGVLVRLRRDEFVLLAADVESTKERITEKPGEALFTLTDITHGRGIIYLAGTHAADVLPKLCALDFAESKFPDLHAAQSSLAKVRALIIRMDASSIPTYFVIVERSVAGYVAEAIYDAAQERGGIVLSRENLNLVRK
jgi:heterotetrameric sarcosine oxidase gamma subunit